MVMPAADPLAWAASFADDLPPSPSVPVTAGAGGPMLASRPKANSSGFQWDAALLPFFKRVGIGHAIVASLIIVIGIGGFFSDTAALAAALVGVVAMVGLVLAAKICFVCIASLGPKALSSDWPTKASFGFNPKDFLIALFLA